MQLLRTIGASPLFLFRLITLEALFIVTMSISLGAGILVSSLFLTQDYLVSSFGLHVSINILSLNNFYLIAAMMTMSLIIAMIPFIVSFIQSQRKKR